MKAFAGLVLELIAIGTKHRIRLKNLLFVPIVNAENGEMFGSDVFCWTFVVEINSEFVASVLIEKILTWTFETHRKEI